MNVKKILSSICIGIMLAILFILLVLFLTDLYNYPLTQHDVANIMEERLVVNFTNIQGSKIYIVQENGENLVYAFEVGVLSNRFRVLWSFNLNELNNAYILGRWRHFHIYISSDSTIEYHEYRGSTNAMGRRIYPVSILSFLTFPVIITFLVHKTFLYDIKTVDKEEAEKQ